MAKYHKTIYPYISKEKKGVIRDQIHRNKRKSDCYMARITPFIMGNYDSQDNETHQHILLKPIFYLKSNQVNGKAVTERAVTPSVKSFHETNQKPDVCPQYRITLSQDELCLQLSSINSQNRTICTKNPNFQEQMTSN